MLAPRTETILKTIVGQYITKATPVSSGSIISELELGVSSATVRNEMAHLEKERYITRPHPSAGSIPLDKGYRSYVTSLSDISFPLSEQRLVNHLFHQVEEELGEWLNLATTLTAQIVQNVALVTIPRVQACQFKHLELVSLQESLVLVVLVLRGAKLRQQLMTFDNAISQVELTTIANKLSDIFSGLNKVEMSEKIAGLSADEKKIAGCLVKIMDSEDNREYEQPYLDGLHYTLNQPELTRNLWLAQTLTELIEQRSLVRSIIPSRLTTGVQVIIGRENEAEVIHDYSVVFSEYGLPEDAIGIICVVGPTRMPYARTIATVSYLSLVLSDLIAKLYGGEAPAGLNADAIN
ncbi:heat-inducible transcriptional repressor HrcA [Chloroflexota bacterium]